MQYCKQSNDIILNALGEQFKAFRENLTAQPVASVFTGPVVAELPDVGVSPEGQTLLRPTQIGSLQPLIKMCQKGGIPLLLILNIRPLVGYASCLPYLIRLTVFLPPAQPRQMSWLPLLQDSTQGMHRISILPKRVWPI